MSAEQSELNRTTLQLTAMLSMLADHVGFLFFDGTSIFLVLRCIGRLAFPLYAFLLADGFAHLQNQPERLRKHTLFLLLLSFLSEFPYDFMNCGTDISSYMESQNVVFTLFFGYVGLACFFRFRDRQSLSFFSLLLPVLCSGLLKSDYGAPGVILIYLLYFAEIHSRSASFCSRVWSFLSVLVLFDITLIIFSGAYIPEEFPRLVSYVPYFLSVLPCAVPLACYHGGRGHPSIVFNILYSWFYPLHMLALGLCRLFLQP